MKKTWKKVVSLLMSVMVVFSMMGVPVMAEEAKAAPTEVASCTASGLWTTVLNFAFKDTAWMNAINSVTVNGTVYTNKTISSFGSDTNIWDIGSATGAYGSYTALRIVSPVIFHIFFCPLIRLLFRLCLVQFLLFFCFFLPSSARIIPLDRLIKAEDKQNYKTDTSCIYCNFSFVHILTVTAPLCRSG